MNSFRTSELERKTKPRHISFSARDSDVSQRYNYHEPKLSESYQEMRLANQSTPKANSRRHDPIPKPTCLTDSVGGEVLEKLTIALKNVRSLRSALEACEEKKTILEAKYNKSIEENESLYTQVNSLCGRLNHLESILEQKKHDLKAMEDKLAKSTGQNNRNTPKPADTYKIASLQREVSSLKDQIERHRLQATDVNSDLKSKIKLLEIERDGLIVALRKANVELLNRDHTLNKAENESKAKTHLTPESFEKIKDELTSLRRDKESMKKILSTALSVLDREKKFQCAMIEKDQIIENLKFELSLLRQNGVENVETIQRLNKQSETNFLNTKLTSPDTIAMQSISTSAIIESNMNLNENDKTIIFSDKPSLDSRPTESIRSRLAAIQESNRQLLAFLHSKARS